MSNRAWIILGILILALAGAGGVALMSRADFLRTVGLEVRRQLETLRPDLTDAQRAEAAAIVAAQAALETGYGSAIAWRSGWNFGNITAGSTWTGSVTEGGDLEYAVDGTVKRIRQRFRRYSSLASAVSDYLTVLNWPRYRPARDALMRGDVVGFASMLRNDNPATAQLEGGYYTAPVGDYLAGINAALPGARKGIA